MPSLPTLLEREQITLGAKVTRNVVYSSVRLFLLAPQPFLLIPYFLKKLGTSGYGTWAVFLAISSVTSLADLGLLTTLSKHVAELYVLGDFRGLGRLVNTGLALYVGIAALLALGLGIGSTLFLSALFRSSSAQPGELRILWHYLILLVVANVLTLLCSSLVIGMQRMDLSALITSSNTLANAGLSVAFLSYSWGLRGILYSYVISAWITLGAYVYILHRLLPEVTLDPRSCRWSVAKEILAFSLKTYTTQMAVVIHNQIEKVYLAHFVGVVQAGWYDISSDLAIKLRAIPSLVLGPIIPAASELSALDDQARLKQLYSRAHKYLAFAAIPLAIFVVFVARTFVRLWAGPALTEIAIPLSVLLLANVMNLTTGPGLMILVGKGRLAPGMTSATAGMALNIIASLVLIRAFGFEGAVVGTSMSLTLGSLLFLYLFHRETGGSFPQVIRSAYLKPIIGALIAVLPSWVLTRSEVVSWKKLAVQAVVFGTCYVGFLLTVRFFDAADLSIAESIIPVRRTARKLVPNRMLNWATRYFPILRALKEHLHDKMSMLEIGAGPYGIGQFYGRSFVGCDLSFSFGPTPPMLPVKATATKLPFHDGSFDAVVASDVLEHVPPEERVAVIRESLRVTRGIAIFGFPSGPEAFKYDFKLAEDYDRQRRNRPAWLDEHMMYPYPTENLFQNLPDEWAITHYGNESASFHYWTMRKEMYRLWNYFFMVLLALVPRLLEYVLRFADREPFYRKIVVVKRRLDPSAPIGLSAPLLERVDASPSHVA